MPNDKINKASVQLNTIEELFSAPEANPFEPNSRYVTGIDELFQQLVQMRVRNKPTQLVITLPAQAIEPGIKEKTQAALARYTAAQIKAADVEIEQLRRRGRFSLISAVVIILGAIVIVLLVGQLARV